MKPITVEYSIEFNEDAEEFFVYSKWSDAKSSGFLRSFKSYSDAKDFVNEKLERHSET